MHKSVCYVTNNYSLPGTPSLIIDDLLSRGGLTLRTAPETLRNAEQIQDWVSTLTNAPECFVTGSLYLLRELGLQKIPVTYVNVIDGKITAASDDIYAIGSIEILDRELEQADRYLKE